jgi:hypothetical protein
MHSNDIEMQDLPDYGTPNETLPVDAVGSSTMGSSSPGTNTTDARLEYIEDFPGDAGTPEAFKKTTFEKIQLTQETCWSPFTSQGEWNFARWLMTSGVSQNKRDSLLELPIVCTYQQIMIL